jgi:hypothetical protein
MANKSAIRKHARIVRVAGLDQVTKIKGDVVTRLDRWRDAQSVPPSRPKAIDHLLGIALDVVEKGGKQRRRK